MAEKQEKPAAAKPLTLAEAQRAYDAIAAETSELARALPAIRIDIQKKVEQQMQEPEKRLTDLMGRKRVAARELEAAQERERPAREAKARQEAAEKSERERQALAEKNAQRRREQETTERNRMAAAVR